MPEVQYPLAKFHFQVEWGGTRLGFTEVSGLTVEVDVIEYREGNMPEYAKESMPGLAKRSKITMKRGTFKGDNDFYNWWNTIALNTAERRDLTISLLNEKHEPVVVWKVQKAFATKVQYGDLKSDANEVAIETIEIAHGGLTVQNG